MDDKELIKRIMEEVKDEKLREELLALVVEKNRRQSEAKHEEGKLVNHKTRHGILSKVGWGILIVILAFGYLVSLLAFGPSAFLVATILAILVALARIIKLLEETRKK